jgi:hypothetical protein
MKQQKRLEQLEAAATPQQLFLLWLKDVQRFAALSDYSRWVAEAPRQRRPGRTLNDCYQRWMNARINLKRGPTQRQARETYRELVLLYRLFWKVNELAAHKTKVASIFPEVGCQYERETGAAIEAELHHYVARLRDGDDDWSCLWVASALAERALKDSPENPELPNAVLEERWSAFDDAVRRLLRDGVIKPGATVCLQPQARGLQSILGTPSLVEGIWVDAHPIELAEVAALVSSHGGDAASRSATAESDFANVARLRAEVKERLRRFPGRSKKIGGRTYLHIVDYLNWPERKAEATVHVGIQAESWDAFIAANGGEGSAELTGIEVCKLVRFRGSAKYAIASLASGIDPLAGANDAPSGAGLDEWTAALPLLVEKIVGLQVGLVALRGAVDTLAEQYFGGRSPLFKCADEQLDRSIRKMQRSANFYNAHIPIAEHLVRELRRVPKGRRRLKPIGPEEGAQQAAAEEKKILRWLDREAQLQTHVSLGEVAAAEDLRCSIIAEERPS